MKVLRSSFLLLAFCSAAFAQPAYLTPLDFGLKLLPHGRIDYTHTPPNILIGNFNSDCYPDIARSDGDKLEVYIFQGNGYPVKPSGERVFQRSVKSLRLDGFIWDNLDNLIVTLADGEEDTLFHHSGCLDLEIPTGFLPPSEMPSPPRYVCDYDFQIVWESEQKPWGMDRCAVGDLDNDGITELVTWWKESEVADSAWFLIYKSVGNNTYELFMQEPFDTFEGSYPGLSNIMITDLDRNGLKELLFTRQWCYFWEFISPGVHTSWRSNFAFLRPVTDIKITDVDQDSIPEIAVVGSHSSLTPPCAYQVEEYYWKSGSPYYTYAFLSITQFYQDWTDLRLDAGDFDNDGAVDIVSGYFPTLVGYDPIDIQYFRYDTTNIYNFTQHWLYTGLPLCCGTPVIADLDADGANEMFAGGYGPNGGSAFIWEATGPDSGYVSWMDTSSMISNPSQSTFGLVDGNPCVMSAVIYWDLINHSQLYLFGGAEGQFSYLWSSPLNDSASYQTPIFEDIDQDGKMSLAIAASGTHRVTDWEQISSGVEILPYPSLPSLGQLHPNYPNPFNGSTIIPFELAALTNIELNIFDIFGRKVFEHSMRNAPAGFHSVKWDASRFSSGIYLVHLRAGSFGVVEKALLVK